MGRVEPESLRLFAIKRGDVGFFTRKVGTYFTSTIKLMGTIRSEFTEKNRYKKCNVSSEPSLVKSYPSLFFVQTFTSPVYP